MKATPILTSLRPGQVRALVLDEMIKKVSNLSMADLARLGISMDERDEGIMNLLKAKIQIPVADAAPSSITTATITTPVQFLQYWIPSAVEIITRARSADDFIGRNIIGSWECEEVVQPIHERTGQVRIYGDTTNVPFMSWNVNFEKRTNVRIEAGIRTGKLEEARASAMRINSYSLKRDAIAEAFAIELNNIAYNGFLDTSTKCYGLLNDPNRPAWVTVAPVTSGGSDTQWSGKTFNQIVADFVTAMKQLRRQTGNNFDPSRDSFSVGISAEVFDALSTVNSLGTLSVFAWIKENYPKARLVPCAELNEVGTGSTNVMIFIADRLGNGPCIAQNVTSAMRLLGVQPTLKGMDEGYTASTAGVFVLQPLGMLCYMGI